MSASTAADAIPKLIQGADAPCRHRGVVALPRAISTRCKNWKNTRAFRPWQDIYCFVEPNLPPSFRIVVARVGWGLASEARVERINELGDSLGSAERQ